MITDAMANNAPLRELVQRAVDPARLDAIVREAAEGRLRLIETVVLDAPQWTLWNMSALMARPDPGELELFSARS